jgi:hypothetical protein
MWHKKDGEHTYKSRRRQFVISLVVEKGGVSLNARRKERRGFDDIAGRLIFRNF